MYDPTKFYNELKSLVYNYLELSGDNVEIISRKIKEYAEQCIKEQCIKEPKKSKRIKKYETEEERIAAYEDQQNNYSKKKWKCDVCDIEINLGNKTKHLLSKKHVKNAACNGDCPTCNDTDSDVTSESKLDNTNSSESDSE